MSEELVTMTGLGLLAFVDADLSGYPMRVCHGGTREAWGDNRRKVASVRVGASAYRVASREGLAMSESYRSGERYAWVRGHAPKPRKVAR